MSIEEKRRAAFEHRNPSCKGIAFENGRYVSRHGDANSIALVSMVNDHWKTWNAALDSICVDLPVKYQDEEGYSIYQVCDVIDSINAAGVKYK